MYRLMVWTYVTILLIYKVKAPSSSVILYTQDKSRRKKDFTYISYELNILKCFNFKTKLKSKKNKHIFYLA